MNEQDADLVYSDEIVLDEKLKNLCEYHFKPDFSPDTLRGCNYITHFLVFSKELLGRAGPEDSAYDGAQDFDLVLRLTEQAQDVYKRQQARLTTLCAKIAFPGAMVSCVNTPKKRPLSNGPGGGNVL